MDLELTDDKVVYEVERWRRTADAWHQACRELIRTKQQLRAELRWADAEIALLQRELTQREPTK